MEIQLGFDIISATVHQIVDITDDAHDEESLIVGLNDGSLCTTTWHEGDKTISTIDVTKTGVPVATILSQEINGEYEDFR